MVVERVNNWFNLSKQYLFTYTGGFFNLSYLSNSPEVMVQSFSKMPFMKHDQKRQLLHADTPFVKGEFFYAELEPGLWIMDSDMTYKNNVSYKPIYDRFLPSDYYFITLNKIENELNSNFYEFNDMKIETYSLSFSKPKKDFLNCHFKGSKEIMSIVYFSEDWAKKNLFESSMVTPAVNQLFEDDEIECLSLAYNEKVIEEMISSVKQMFGTDDRPNIFGLKKLGHRFFELFFELLEFNTTFEAATLKPKDKLKVQKIEHHLMERLHHKFPGIPPLSKQFKISPTKLKEDFKKRYGVPIFQYFAHRKMDLALSYLEKTDLKIGEIAAKLGYENTSKFSKTFEKYHGRLPSRVIR